MSGVGAAREGKEKEVANELERRKEEIGEKSDEDETDCLRRLLSLSSSSRAVVNEKVV